jgi:hypothetical protein
MPADLRIIEILITQKSGNPNYRILLLMLPPKILLVMHSEAPIFQREPENHDPERYLISNRRIFIDLRFNILILKNDDIIILAADNELGRIIVVHITKTYRQHLVPCYIPIAVFPLTIKRLYRTMAPNKYQNLRFCSCRAYKSTFYGRYPIRNFLMELITVSIGIVGGQSSL